MTSQDHPYSVTPAKAGVHMVQQPAGPDKQLDHMDSRLRGNDDWFCGSFVK
jgi:hypothetical protein